MNKLQSILTLPKFVKRLGYKSAHERECIILLKMLQKKHTIEIQQSGFKGHSLAHSKIVVIHEPINLEKVEFINRNLRVNFTVGPYSIHRATKPFKCDDCSTSIWPGERYGSRFKIGRRNRRSGFRGHIQIYQYKILCLPCMILRYDDIII